MSYSGGGFRRPKVAGAADGLSSTYIPFKEHRTLMATVVKRILSMKSGLNEAFTSLLRGFEVCDVVLSIEFY